MAAVVVEPTRPKIVVRNLPCSTTLEEIVTYLQSSPSPAARELRIVSFKKGKAASRFKSREEIPASVIIQTETGAAVPAVVAAFDGKPFKSQENAQLIAAVEYTPLQRTTLMNASRQQSSDPEAGKIYQDTDYLDFVRNLDNAANVPSTAVGTMAAKQQLDDWMQQQKAAAVEQQQTPLVQAMIDNWYHRKPFKWQTIKKNGKELEEVAGDEASGSSSRSSKRRKEKTKEEKLLKQAAKKERHQKREQEKQERRKRQERIIEQKKREKELASVDGASSSKKSNTFTVQSTRSIAKKIKNHDAFPSLEEDSMPPAAMAQRGGATSSWRSGAKLSKPEEPPASTAIPKPRRAHQHADPARGEDESDLRSAPAPAPVKKVLVMKRSAAAPPPPL